LGVGVERVALPDRADALQRTVHERVEDVGPDPRPRWAGAHLALVERVQDRALDCFNQLGRR
jgi:hypothetical protein